MIGWFLARLGVPTPDAVPTVGDARDRRREEALIHRAPDVVRTVRFPRLVPVMGLVRRLEIDDRSGEFTPAPVLGRRTRVNPLHRVGVIAVAALVAEHGQPLLVLPVLPGEVHAGWMRGDEQAGVVLEHRAADALPLLGFRRVIASIAGEDEETVGRLVSLDLESHECK